jgi:hypothetical protein
MTMIAVCACQDSGVAGANLAFERRLGVDETHGRFADVSLKSCSLCGRLWLHYHVEYEAFSQSGRWAMAVIDETTAATITPETAADYIDRQPGCVIGGSYWSSAGMRSAGPLNWG